MKNGSSLRFQLAFLLGRDSTVHLATVRPTAPQLTDGDSEASARGTPAYHVHLDEQDTQGEALPEALQPLVDVVWVEVVVAEAGGRGGGDWEVSCPQEPFFTLTGMQRAWVALLGLRLREVKQLA